MLKPTPEMLRALGVTEDELGADPLVDSPDANIGKGDAAAVMVVSIAVLQSLLQSLAAQVQSGDAHLVPASSVEVVERLQTCAPDASVHRFTDHPNALVVHVPAASVTLTGAHQTLSADEFMLADGGAARVDGPQGSALVVCGDGGKAAVFELSSPRLAELAAWEPGEAAVVTPPAPSKLTGGLAIEPWLAAAVHDALESDAPLDRVAAVGLMGRLWSPVDRADAAAARQRSLAGAGPGQDGRAWWASIPEAEREGLVSTALLRVDDLADALGDLSDHVAEDPEAARPALLRWLHARDDLASVAFLARSSSPGGVLETALQRLDEAAAAHHSMWAFVPAFEDERLQAVAECEFEVWWGRLAQDP
ncbi:MAG: hypothetical protein ACOC1F_07180 [Myxococcota bacterium]